MPLYSLEGHIPQVDPSAFVAPSADLIGKVTVLAQASIWFGAVLRGDIEPITIGPGSNVQDGVVIHTDAGWPCTLAEQVTVGHRAVLHGATCEAGSVVGMGAVMLNGSSLGVGAMLGAGALLPEGMHVPDGMLALGIPAKVIRPVPSAGNAARYIQNAQRYIASLQCLEEPELEEPELEEPEAGAM